MNVNLHLSGEAEAYVNALVTRGLAANKTEAIRLAIVKCRDREMELELEVRELEQFQRASMKAIFDNKGDDEAEKFYTEKYLHGKKGRDNPRKGKPE